MFQPECANPTDLRSPQSSDRTEQFRRRRQRLAISNGRSRPIRGAPALLSSCPQSQCQKIGRELDCAQENPAPHRNVVTTGCPKRALLQKPDGTSLASRQASRPTQGRAVAPAGPKVSKDNAEFLRG